MSSFLTLRYVDDENTVFKEGMKHTHFLDELDTKMYDIHTHRDIDIAIREIINNEVNENTAILLSSWIDSAILASYLKPGTKAYTLQCQAKNAINESDLASEFAKKYKLDHNIIPIYWEDYLELTPQLMRYHGSPIHSIAPQLLKAINISKQDGITKILSGYGADCLFGGVDRILSKDWQLEEFIPWYTFVDPEKVLKNPISLRSAFEKFVNENGKVDIMRFIHDGALWIEGATSFNSAFGYTNIHNLKVYTRMRLAKPLDLARIRNKEGKYLLRTLFRERYPEFNIPDKIPLPRAMEQWLENWDGPIREEFLPNCIKDFTGDQKWLVYCLEWFLNLTEWT